MNEKILFIANKYNDIGGRQNLTERNKTILSKIFQKKTQIFLIKKKKLDILQKIRNLILGHIDGVDNIVLNDILKKIKKNNIKYIFIDGSNLGEVAKFLKKKIRITIFIFFHNVESYFFYKLFIKVKTIKSFVIFLINYISEKKSIKYADKIISLSNRDSQLLDKVYGRKPEYIFPVTVRDVFKKKEKINNYNNYLLFIGSAFYANRFGIEWFINNVLPKINLKVFIIGRGFEKYKHKYEKKNKLKVLGYVKNLKQMYTNANLVIAPIFDGSGMKTKIAEAMMYGKKIIGTEESFSGYDHLNTGLVYFANDSNSFINIINKHMKKPNKKFYYNIRKVYKKYYSNNAAEKYFQKFFNTNVKK